MISLDGGFLLTILPWGVLDKVADHYKLWEWRAPYNPWVICRVMLNQGVLLVMHCFPQRVVKAFCRAEGKVKEDNIVQGLQVLTRLELDHHRVFVFLMARHLQQCLLKKLPGIPFTPEACKGA